MATLGQNAFGNPGNPGQFAAIQNGANSNSLVSQLFAAKPMTTSTPQTIAASSAVKNVNAPSNATPFNGGSTPNGSFSGTPTPTTAQPTNASLASLLMGPLGTSSPATANTPTTTYPQAPIAQTVVDNSGGTANPNANYTGLGPNGNTPISAPAGTPVSNQSTQTTSTAPTGINTATGDLTQQGLLTQEEGLISNQNSEQAGLTSQEQTLENNFANMNAGILSQPGEIGYQTGRQAELQQTENTGLAALEGSQAQLAAYEQPQLAALQNAASQLSPQSQEITPPAGGVTTLANTGQQFSNPIYEPASSAVQAYSPQPNGTPGQPSTVGQASQYTIKSGDTLDNIAAANGTTEAALLAANPQITNPNNISAGASLTIPASGTGNTAFSGGIAAGQAVTGQQQVANQTALAEARTVQSSINTLLADNPTLNTNPDAARNAIQAWAQSTAVPTGPYVNLLNDLQEYANTIAPVLGVGGAPTDNKIAIAQQLIPLLASGQTIQQAIQNLDSIAVGKINAVPAAAQNAAQPAQAQTTSTGNSSTAGSWAWTPTQ